MAEVAVNEPQPISFQSHYIIPDDVSTSSTSDTDTSFQQRAHPVLPHFSFSPATPALSQDCSAALPLAAETQRRSHKRKASNALPAFTFNPAAADALPQPPRAVTPPHIPTFEAPTTPTRGGRHRRSASEYIGGHGIKQSVQTCTDGGHGIGQSVQTPTADETSDETPSAATAAATAPPPPPLAMSAGKRGHRHKRSAAISQDLTSITRRPSIPEGILTADVDLITASSSSSTARPATPLQQLSSPSFSIDTSIKRSDSPSPPPRPASQTRVGFSDIVEVIPRPISIVSTGSDTSTILSVSVDSNSLSPNSSPATTRRINGSLSLLTSSSALTTSSAARPSTPFRSQFEAESAAVAARDALQEDEDDDFEPPTDPDDDPTSVVISPTCTSDFASSYIPMSFSTTHKLYPDYIPNDANGGGGGGGAMIDLDAALGPFKTPMDGFGGSNGDGGSSMKRRGFATARHVMHSSGTTLHRRTESAPTLVPMSYDSGLDQLARPLSQGGYQMENVFEEDEEDSMIREDDTPRESPTRPRSLEEGNKNSSLPAVPATNHHHHHHHHRYLETTGGAEVVSPSYTADASSSGSTLGAPMQPSFRQTPLPTTTDSSSQVQCPPFLVAPCHSGTPDTPTTSSYPSAPGSAADEYFYMERVGPTDSRKSRLNGFGSSVSELRQSVDDVPSLISYGSTANSTVDNTAPSTSSRSFVGQRVSATSSLSVTSSAHAAAAAAAAAAERRRKRSSIASLSRLMTGPFMDKSTLSLDQGIPRCVTSDGSHDPRFDLQRQQQEQQQQQQQQKKPRRLGRFLKFWKSKDVDSSSSIASSPLRR